MIESEWLISELDEDEPLPTTTGEDDSSESEGEGVGDDGFEGGVEPTDFSPDEALG